MSMGDADAKFPGQHTGIAPSPTRENPGQVYPKSDPSPAPNRTPNHVGGGTTSTQSSVMGNPYVMQNAMDKVDNALSEGIAVLQKEGRSQGGSSKEEALLQKFQTWRNELHQGGGGSGSDRTKQQSFTTTTEVERAGGMFTD